MTADSVVGITSVVVAASVVVVTPCCDACLSYLSTSARAIAESTGEKTSTLAIMPVIASSFTLLANTSSFHIP